MVLFLIWDYLVLQIMGVILEDFGDLLHQNSFLLDGFSTGSFNLGFQYTLVIQIIQWHSPTCLKILLIWYLQQSDSATHWCPIFTPSFIILIQQENQLCGHWSMNSKMISIAMIRVVISCLDHICWLRMFYSPLKKLKLEKSIFS